MPASTNPYFARATNSPGVGPRGTSAVTPIQPATKAQIGGTVSIAGPVEVESAGAGGLAQETGGQLQLIAELMTAILAELQVHTALMVNAGFAPGADVAVLRADYGSMH